MMMSRANRPAFTLTEMLCVFVLLAVLGVILAQLLRQIVDVEHVQAASFDRSVQHMALADQFRDDVARAEAAPARWGNFGADERTLILQMKGEQHVVYVFHDGQLQRHAFDRQGTSERTMPIGDRTEVTFETDRKLPLIRLHLITLRNEKPVAGQGLEIAAALGGDWR